MSAPADLGAGGKRLWKSITDDHELDAAQMAQLEEACREKDRCDALARMIDAEDDSKVWLTLVAKANETANQMKQLLAALRLPDAQTGKKPQRRGPRGAYQTGAGAKVSSIDRARQRSQTG
jgi:hypothetical protein